MRHWLPETFSLAHTHDPVQSLHIVIVTAATKVIPLTLLRCYFIKHSGQLIYVCNVLPPYVCVYYPFTYSDRYM